MELVSIKDACKALGVGRTTLWRMCDHPSFPKPIELTERRKAFIKVEIEDWIASRIADRDRRVA